MLATAAGAGAANVLAAVTPSFTVLMVARIIAALAAAASTPSLFALAARLSPPDKIGRYVAVVALGVTGAISAGVPVGTWTIAIGVAVFIGTMLALFGLWVSRPVPVIVLYPLVMLWGAAVFWNSPAVQARLHVLAGPASAQALVLNTSGSYLGVAAGGAVGGLVLDTGGSGLLPIVAACSGLLTLALFRVAGAYALKKTPDPFSRVGR